MRRVIVKHTAALAVATFGDDPGTSRYMCNGLLCALAARQLQYLEQKPPALAVTVPTRSCHVTIAYLCDLDSVVNITIANTWESGISGRYVRHSIHARLHAKLSMEASQTSC